MTLLKFLYLLFFCFLSSISIGQKSNPDTLRLVQTEYAALVKAGRLKEAVSCLSGLLASKVQLTAKEKLAFNNNLGILHKNLGQYDLALRYYSVAESIFLNDSSPDNSLLVSIYGNKVNIYSMKEDFNKALEYCEKAIRVVNGSNGTLILKQQSISSLYLNAGIIYYQLNDYTKALTAFQKSISIKDKYQLSGKDNVYLNLARTYSKIENNILADKYFNLSISQSKREDRNPSIKVVNFYLEYGHFLIAVNQITKALAPIQKALAINLKQYGEKNQLTSNCYQLMGDYYRISKDYHSALNFYQKALISDSKDFADMNIEVNPSVEDVTHNLWQLRVLRRKAEVLAILAEGETDKAKKIRNLSISLNTSNLAIEMTNTIRVDYQDEETRLIFNEKQKNVFVSAIETTLKLYELTGEKKYLNLAYQTTQRCKANELKYEIARNKSYANNGIPDSLQSKEKDLLRNIAAYGVLIRDESAKAKPDSVKTTYWKDQQFNLNRILEKTVAKIESDYPRFTDKLKRGNIMEIGAIQASLMPEESLVEYVISDKNEQGDHKLFEFVITPQNLICHTEVIDSTKSALFSELKTQLTNQFAGISNIGHYNQLNQQLYECYNILIRPIEKYFAGKQLIIIPDDEISYLPFDAFLSSYEKKKRINFAELNFLIRDYSISYGYSTSTLWNQQPESSFFPKVIGFSPDYSTVATVTGNKYKSLKANNMEIESILSNFSGSVLKNDQATITNFRLSLNSGAILHLAMHAELDTAQAGSSSLIFTPGKNGSGIYRLYNYEIGQMSIDAPMVVLSACSTGNGRLYSGEGLMSLARSFILAGVPAVVETLWPVEDIAGSKIMGSFYRYLSQGQPKSKALRQAKLDYINNSSPSYVNPRFWAAYSLMGDDSAVKKIWWKEKMVIISLIITILLLVILYIYRLRFLKIN